MKLLLENWNAYIGKVPLNESQKLLLEKKHPILHDNGILELILESKCIDYKQQTALNIQNFYEDSISFVKKDILLEIIKNGIKEQEELPDENEDEEGEEEEDQDDEEFDPFSHLKKFEIPEDDQINEDEDCVLFFGTTNKKLSYLNVTSFSLPAGYTCPFADICLSKFPRHGKKGDLKDYGEVRCFAASTEAAYRTVRERRWRNFDLLKRKSADEIGDLISKSIKEHERTKRGIQILRIHDSGDFFNQNYFDGWLQAAKERPDIIFYAYTKAIPFWKARKEQIPPNLRLIASRGGKADDQIEADFREATIVSGVEEAIEKNLNIDVNEFLAIFGEGDFALLLHGTQKKGRKIGDEKATNVARSNEETIKDAAEELDMPKWFIQKLIDKIVNAAREIQDNRLEM